jgi:outer membrane autotransporter protein
LDPDRSGNWYVDTVAMYTWLDGDSHSDRGVKLDNHGHALTLSAEAGYPFPWQAPG